LGNFFTVRDLLDQGVPGEVIRFVFLSTHYRKPMDWTEAKRREAEATLRKWWRITRVVEEGNVHSAVIGALRDDLNTPRAIAELHQLAHVADAPTLKASARLLGLLTDEARDWAQDDEIPQDTAFWIEQLLGERASARASKNWQRADELRDQLLEAGIEIRDGSEPGWALTGRFDPTKLEAIR
ncbi:MAG: DALR domain-containing protein, partial [Pseudomonadota bacterium]